MSQPPTDPGPALHGQQPNYGQPAHGQQPQYGQPQYPTQGPPGGGHQGGGPPASNTNKLLVVLIVVLVLGLAGLGAFVLLSKSSDTDAGVTAGESSTTVPVTATTPDGKPLVTTTPKSTTTAKSAAPTTAAPGVTTTANSAAPTTAAPGVTTATTATPASCGASPALFATGLVDGDPFVTAQLDPAGSTRQFDLVLDSGDVVQVDVIDLDFDPVVELFDSNGTSLGLNDDGPVNSDSQLITTTGVSGLHTVEVSAFDSTQCGLFEVAVTIVSSGPGTALSPPSVNNQFVTLGATPELFNVDVVAGDSVTILVVDGSGTDPFITVNDPAGAPFGQDDDSGSITEGPLDALIEFVAPSSGRFAVFVESVNGVSGSAQVTILIN